jgi:hypothetical protein
VAVAQANTPSAPEATVLVARVAAALEAPPELREQ